MTCLVRPCRVSLPVAVYCLTVPAAGTGARLIGWVRVKLLTGKLATSMIRPSNWASRWLEALRSTVREAGLRLDWTSPSAYRFERFAREALEADGIRCLGTLAGDEYRARACANC